jgi:hypothetical protein
MLRLQLVYNPIQYGLAIRTVKKRLITIPSPNEITKNKQSISKGSWARAPPLNAVLIQFQS